MGTGWVSVYPSPLSENTPPPLCRSGAKGPQPSPRWPGGDHCEQARQPTSNRHATQRATTCYNTTTDALSIYRHSTSSTRTTPRTHTTTHRKSVPRSKQMPNKRIYKQATRPTTVALPIYKSNHDRTPRQVRAARPHARAKSKRTEPSSRNKIRNEYNFHIVSI